MIDKFLNFRESWLWKALMVSEKTVMIICGAGVTALLCFETLIRYFFRLPLYSYEEVATIFCVWLYFIGASYALSNKASIQADMASLFLKERGQKINALLVSLISAFVSIVLSLWSFDFMKWAFAKNAITTGLKIPMVVSQMSICVGYTLMAFYSVLFFLEDLILFVRWRRERKA